MPKPRIHSTSTDEEILEAIRHAGTEESEGWVTVDNSLTDQRTLSRLQQLVDHGKLEKKRAWKNSAPPEAMTLARRLTRPADHAGAYMVGYDPSKFLVRISQRPK